MDEFVCCGIYIDIFYLVDYFAVHINESKAQKSHFGNRGREHFEGMKNIEKIITPYAIQLVQIRMAY